MAKEYGVTVNRIRKEATKVRKAMNGNVTLEAIVAYIKQTGHGIVYFNIPWGDEELRRYDLVDTAKTKKGFVYHQIAQIVFIDDTLPHTDKIRVLLHELGHIVLGHIDEGVFALKDHGIQELEAHTFARMMLDGGHMTTDNHWFAITAMICVVMLAGLKLSIVKGGATNG